MNLRYLMGVPIIIPFMIGIYRYKNLNDLRWLFYLVCYGVINEIASVLLIMNGAKNTLPKVHLYTIVSTILLILLYKSVLKNNIKRGWFWIVIASYLFLYFLNLLFFQSIFEYPSLPYSISSILLIVFSIMYFHKVMVEARIANLAKEPFIWINTAILIYFTGNLFYHILFNLFLDNSRTFLKTIGGYMALLNGLYYILIAIGFFLTKPKGKR